MNLKGHIPKKQGKRIDNLPAPHVGTLTGNYNIDHYGCWWEVKPDDKDEPFWMIGEYPV